MSDGRSGDPGRGPKESYFGYKVYDQHYEEVGKVDEMFVDQNDRPTYLGLKIGLLGTKYTLIPMDLVRVNDRRELVEVADSKGAIEGAPQFDDVDELTAAQETEVRSYYGLPARGQRPAAGERPAESAFEERPRVDLGYGERRGSTGESISDPPAERPASPPEYVESRDFAEEPRPEPAAGRSYEASEAERAEEERVAGESPGASREDALRKEAAGTTEREEELRIQRAEEELRAGTREREAGEVNVRKRVRTDQEQIKVPKKREEVVVERVPVEGDAETASTETGGGISPSESEEDIRVPVVEEEVVVEKRPVVKEEIRLRKRVVEEEAVVEEEVRKEEVEVDETDYRDQR